MAAAVADPHRGQVGKREVSLTGRHEVPLLAVSFYLLPCLFIDPAIPENKIHLAAPEGKLQS